MRKLTYGITLSPPMRSLNEIKDFRHDVLIMRKITRHTDHYQIIPELDWKGRLHYHGIFIATKQGAGRVTRTLKTIGYVKLELLKTPLNHLRFLLYTQKDWYENRHLFDNIITPYTIKKWHPIIRKTSIMDYFK